MMNATLLVCSTCDDSWPLRVGYGGRQDCVCICFAHAVGIVCPDACHWRKERESRVSWDALKNDLRTLFRAGVWQKSDRLTAAISSLPDLGRGSHVSLHLLTQFSYPEQGGLSVRLLLH
jgi:hypothetical protein